MILIKLEKRQEASAKSNAIILVLSVLLALAIASLIFAAQGVDPISSYKEIFLSAFASSRGLAFTITKAIPLALCGIGLTLVFKANIWNIGAEGQLLLGSITATWLALFALRGYPSLVLIPLMFILGFMAGAAWAFIPAILKAKLNVNEIIVTLMLNYVAFKLVEYLIYGPWRGAREWGFPITEEFPKSAWLPQIPGTQIHYPTLALALVSAALVYLLMSRTKIGFEAKVYGLNPDAARYAGINHLKVILITMLISGGLAGLAGVGEVAGIHHRLRYPWSISCGYGYAAIIVAWLARLNPLAAIPVSIFLGGLFVGGYSIQTSLNLPFSVVNMFNGLILSTLVASEILFQYRIKLVKS
ncbi:MAG: ABC transporter permease [Candidatus Methanomethylicota archaeon]|uniref:ABC transporter permease n=1 Tax=Thermoproteota archaeon TaxID=2056631 RepID=A0A497ERZ8_9CREN|nr:MAG: ABC transporter permease [Candidatus Verstraetearchaeota archaeon]RLE53109.1 MAG: ABC transporter permease [Candidatus Verstraetearchaeota archaeon]